MNSKDLPRGTCRAPRQDRPSDSLKVEGRTKSIYYVARTAGVSPGDRRCGGGRPFNFSLLGALDALANRGYTDGFYERHHSHEHQNYMRGHSVSTRQQYVATSSAAPMASRK